MAGAIGRAPAVMVDALLPAPQQVGRGLAASSSTEACLTPEQAYLLTLDRETSMQSPYRRASTRDAIEVFGRAIGPIAAARYWARKAGESCVTPVATTINTTNP